MTTPGTAAAADIRLTAFAAELASAEASDPPDPGHLAATAWVILSELTAATYSRIDTERALIQAFTAAQASVASDLAGAPDPLAHLRRFLAAHGKMPSAGVTSRTILAWQGTPPACRDGHREPGRPARLAASPSSQLRARPAGS